MKKEYKQGKTNILCPDCFKGKLIQDEGSDCHCENCGTDFIRIAENTVRYK